MYYINSRLIYQFTNPLFHSNFAYQFILSWSFGLSPQRCECLSTFPAAEAWGQWIHRHSRENKLKIVENLFFECVELRNGRPCICWRRYRNRRLGMALRRGGLESQEAVSDYFHFLIIFLSNKGINQGMPFFLHFSSLDMLLLQNAFL